REVAIKLLPQGATGDQLKRFRHEARELAALTHPNVVALLDAGEHAGRDFLVMEFVAGGNLYDFLAGSPSLSELVEVFAALCEGLEYIHGQGLVHRDLKPENLLFTADRVPKIADLGVVRRVDQGSSLTRSGMIVGTCEYVAPEQILSSEVGPAADLYSLGTCLFETLAGRTPFVGETEFTLLQAHLREHAPALRSVRPEMPESLDLLLGRLLEKQPDSRPRSAGQVREQLMATLEELKGSQPGPSRAALEESVPITDVTGLVLNLSQEIWNPMNGIIGMTRLLRSDTGLTPVQRQYVEAVESSAEALSQVFRGLIDYSKLEAGTLRLDAVPTDLRGLVQSVVESEGARAQGVGVYSQVDLSVPDSLICDPLRVRQILSNLVSNAVKFTPAGQVSVSVLRDHDEPGHVNLRFVVADTGMGIPEDQLRQLFVPSHFERRRAQLQTRPGAGLGLVITSRLVQLMGGRIWADSVPGRGSTFTVTLRLPVAGSIPDTEPAVPSRPLRLLLAEDQPINQTLAVALLNAHGHQVRAVSNGREALKALEEEPFDAVLMDVQMPEMDGLEATRAIRAREKETGAHIPVVALTALDREGGPDLCLQAGMDAYVPKPLEERDLLRALARVVGDADPELRADEEPVDLESMLARVGGSRRLVRTLVEVFLDTGPGQLELLDEHFRSRNAAALAQAADNLRTSLVGINAGPAARAAQKLEMLAREGRLEAALHARRQLLVEVERLLDRLTDLQDSLEGA
ncbi:MAG: protein kinase, partial [Candidatus Eremiobacterota bacterium]